MKRHCLLAGSLVLVGLLVTPVAGFGQDDYNYNVNFLVGLGGSVDENDAGFGNFDFQLGAAVYVESHTQVAVRLGLMDWGENDELGELTGSRLTYLTIAGEYRDRRGFFSGALFDSALFAGLGAYNLEGTDLDLEDFDQTAIGLTVGASGDFDVSKRFAIRLEGSGHYAGLDHAKFFVMLNFGLAYRF
ncbi:MAG: hypothetical protein EP299_09945 [Acidobacteria bacterium]|nr:MAG: hypothetical protein EP299_09945 [Acidobacteriota bacterium]